MKNLDPFFKFAEVAPDICCSQKSCKIYKKTLVTECIFSKVADSQILKRTPSELYYCKLLEISLISSVSNISVTASKYKSKFNLVCSLNKHFEETHRLYLPVMVYY